MKYQKTLWVFAGVVVLGFLIIGPRTPGSGFTRGSQRITSERQLTGLAWSLISYAEDHSDNIPTSIASLPDDAFQQYSFALNPYAHGNHIRSSVPDAEPNPFVIDVFSHHSYIATADRRHLIIFERPGLWDDHTIAYVDLDMRGKWTWFRREGFEGGKINRVTEQQFAEYLSKIQVPEPNQSTEDQLVEAAETGDSQKLEDLLSEGTSVDGEDQRGWTALTSAAQAGQFRIVDLLIAKGAKVDVRDSFGMGRTALMRASASGQTAIVETLFAHRADVHIKREDGTGALTDALPYPEIVAKLLAAGADGNEQIRQDWSPLIAACSEGYAGSARLLIEHGADVKRDGLAAFDAAVRNDQGDAIDVLLSKGLSLDKETLGQYLSFAYSSPGAMKKLISVGADPNTKCTCPGGRSALMVAAINGCPDTVDLLIGAGADLNDKDENGHTVLDLLLAETRPGSEWMLTSSGEKVRLQGIVDVLRKSGAKESGKYVEWPEPQGRY